MKIIFFGTPFFAAEILQHLIQKNYDIAAIVCPPDKMTGRGKKIKSCAVKKRGLENKINILQPENLSNDLFIKSLKEFNADIFLIVAFRMLPEIIWKIPSKGAINLHTSLLPNYKGAAPINWVLINGEKETGITTFFINNKIDSGDIIMQQKITLKNNTTAAQLHNIMIKNGSILLEKSLQQIIKSNHNAKKQIENNYQKAPKLTKDVLKINWKKSAYEIHNLVRGLSPFLDKNSILKNISICPSAYFNLVDQNGKIKRIKVFLTEIIDSESDNSLQIKSDNKTYLNIVTLKNEISIKNLQMEGKKPMTIKQFLQGNKITKDHKII